MVGDVQGCLEFAAGYVVVIEEKERIRGVGMSSELCRTTGCFLVIGVLSDEFSNSRAEVQGRNRMLLFVSKHATLDNVFVAF
ncbi:Fc.00g090400.m01.CDS01 [Cosmosporella sp. VM-42]